MPSSYYPLCPWGMVAEFFCAPLAVCVHLPAYNTGKTCVELDFLRLCILLVQAPSLCVHLPMLHV